jgi:hypothetical protein
MPATQSIITDTFITGADRGLALANADWVREFSWGNDWGHIRLGAYFTCTANGTSDITSWQFAFGVCNGTDKPWGSTPDNWVGYRSPATGLGTFARLTLGGVAYYRFGSNRGRLTCVQSGSEVAGVSLVTGGLTQIQPYTNSPPARTFIMLDIVKGSPSYTLTYYDNSANVNNVLQDYQPWRFGEHMTRDANTRDSAILVPQTPAGTVTANESTGDLDCMNIYWNQATFPLRIHALAAVRYY